MIIHASNGCVLTQKAAVPISQRVFRERIHVTNLSEFSDWKEIPTADKDKMLAKGAIIDVDNMDVAALKRVDAIVSKIAARINDLPMSVEESLELRQYYPEWKAGELMPIGKKVQHQGGLYEVIQEHTSQEDWNPINAVSLFKIVQIEATGTKEDAIHWKQGMSLENGKHYVEGEITYLCFRDSGMPLYYSLADLVGLYVEVVE